MITRIQITETQARKMGIIKESEEPGKYRTVLETKEQGQVDFYYESELKTFSEIDGSFDPSYESIEGQVIINWSIYQTDNSYGITNFSIDIKSIVPDLHIEYETQGGEFEEVPLNLDLNTFEIVPKVTINRYGNFYPSNIEFDFKRKIIIIE